MIKWLHSKLKWLVASKELSELHRWQAYCNEAEQWFAEFPESRTALEFLRSNAEGQGFSQGFIHERRDQLRKHVDSIYSHMAAANKALLAADRLATCKHPRYYKQLHREFTFAIMEYKKQIVAKGESS